MKMPPHKVQQLDDDGLLTPEVKDYAEEKYSLVKLYCHLFTTSVRNKWDELVYLDLFAGAGRSRVVGAERILPGSPVLALDLEHPFDRYVFCEKDAGLMSALRQRVHRDFPGRVVEYVPGDVNQKVDVLLDALPIRSRTHKVLSFCFVDPFGMGNLNFRTIAQLSKRYMDFLILVPTGYDANRNWVQNYTRQEDPTVAEFLGDADWRDAWEVRKTRNESVDTFLTNAFGASMERLDYKFSGIGETYPIRLTENKVRIYRLAFFSRNKLGRKLWRQVMKYAPDQRSLF